jgi:hypothetical protein
VLAPTPAIFGLMILLVAVRWVAIVATRAGFWQY